MTRRQAQADGVDLDHRQIAVAVGRAVPVKLAGPAQVICDDTTVVRIEVAEGALRVVGVKAGKTQCGFYSVVRGAFRIVFDVTVTPAD